MSAIGPTDPLEAALLLADAFETHGIPYAIGGALAYGLWGVPRATIDVDINVFVDDRGLATVRDALQSVGVPSDLDDLRAAAAGRGMFSTRFGEYRVDLFTPSIAFCREAERTRTQCTIEGRTAWFLSAEALAVFKLLFFRAKDIVDLQRLLAVRGEVLDVDYVCRQVVAMMGEEDERVQRWHELVAAFRVPEGG